MTVVNDTSLEDEFERRASERTPRNRGAMLRISGLNSLFALTARDTSDHGSGMRLHLDLPLLPIDFEMSIVKRASYVARSSPISTFC
jgi:hypothetical protein